MAIRLNNLARLLQATNRLAEAEPLMRRALAILEASLPDHHPWVLSGRENLKALLEAIEAAKREAPGDPLTPTLSPRGEGDAYSPQGGNPLPQGERGTAPRRGLFARWFGRR